jgi:hypothetical protein
MYIFKYVVSILALAVTAAVALGALGSNFNLLSLPYGEATVAASATISIDDREYTGSSIWRVKAQTQNGWPDSGINYHQWVLGDAIEFEIGNGTYAFLRPQTSNVMRCARGERPEVEYLAEALPLFKGPCTAEPQGALTFVTFGPNGVPNFTNFLVNREGELRTDGGGTDLPPDIQAIARRNFALLSLTLTATPEPLPDGMVQRFPWILDLPRADVWQGRRLEEGGSVWQLGKTYMQYFTTDIPE